MLTLVEVLELPVVEEVLFMPPPKITVPVGVKVGVTDGEPDATLLGEALPVGAALPLGGAVEGEERPRVRDALCAVCVEERRISEVQRNRCSGYRWRGGKGYVHLYTSLKTLCSRNCVNHQQNSQLGSRGGSLHA